MTSIFEGQPPKTRPFPTKTRVIWVPGIYIFFIHNMIRSNSCKFMDENPVGLKKYLNRQ